MKKKNLGRFIADNFWLQRMDFIWAPLFVLGTWAAFAVIFCVIYLFVRDEEILTLGIPGVIALAMTTMFGVIWAVSRIVLEFRVGVQLGQTRRRMLLAELLLSLVTGAETLALSVLLNQAWQWLARAMLPGAEIENLFVYIPPVGWAALLLLPVAVGTCCGALVLRFGARAGWTLYLVFMAACLSPSVLESRLENSVPLKETVLALWSAVLPWLPVLLAAAAAALLAGAWAMLRRIAIS